MGSYYYLAAQLPYLIYGQPVPMSSSAFKDLAKGAMSAADAKLLESCALSPAPLGAENGAGPGVLSAAGGPSSASEPAARGPSEFLNRFREWERVLRLCLARGRVQRLKREGGAFDAPEYPADAADTAKAALAMESPLEAEIFLDKARWDAIESFQGLSSFSENAMYAYLLKLLLMERRTAFKAEEGFTEYKGLYAAILGEPK